MLLTVHSINHPYLTCFRDAQRLQQHTVASAPSHAYREHVLFRVDGYDIKQLMADERYKMSAALHAAGLSGSEYAQHLIVNARPAR